MATTVTADAEWRTPLNWFAWFFATIGSEVLRASACTSMKAWKLESSCGNQQDGGV